MPPTTRLRRYRGTPYWEQETPKTVTTEKLRVAFYPKAGKLQVSALWKNRHSGEVKPGRTAVLDATELAANPDALSLLEAFLNVARS